MKRVLIISQALLLILFAGIICFTSAPKTAVALIFCVVMLIIVIAGFLVPSASEKKLRGRVTELLRELSVASSRIGSVSQEIGITIAESDESSSALFSETREMRDLTADVSENLTGMIAQLKIMISCAEEARSTALTMDQTSRASFETIQHGMAEILRIVDTMREIKATSSKAGDSIEKLKTASLGVRAIIETINDISKQMHIIAINATVEASRAGHYGDSFAVVAKEFHNLSNMTDKSMYQISTLVDAIQRDILDVCDIVMENSGRVDEGVRYTKVIEESLKAIRTSFGDVIKMVGTIGAIAEEEARLATGMGGSIESVETLIDRQSGNVRRVVDSALDQKRGIANIADMGTKLQSASMELLNIGGGGAADTTEKLDDKTRRSCEQFFPVIKNELGRHPGILENDQALHHDILSRFKTSHNIAEAVWTNELNGRFICSIPKAGIANAAMRDWFRASLKGESYISPIYISGITKNRCVTLSLPYYDGDGAMAGIVGVDLNLDLLKTEKR